MLRFQKDLRPHLPFSYHFRQSTPQRRIRFENAFIPSVLYSAANDPRLQMIPRPEMIPKLDRKGSRTSNNPRCGPQMIPPENDEWQGVWFPRMFFNFCIYLFSSTK